MEFNQFNQHLNALVGNEVNILLTDGNTVQGVLAAIKSDYFVMESDNSTIFHNLKNVKGFLKSTKNSKNTKKTKSLTDYSGEGMTLREVLEGLQSKWVSIDIQSNNNNQGYSGFLAAIEDDYVILIGKDLQVHLNIAHINNIVKTMETQNNTSNENNSNTNSSNTNDTSIRMMEFESVFRSIRK